MTTVPSSEQFLNYSAMVSCDPLALSQSENPNSALTSVLFDGNNFITWHRQIRLMLSARLKLGFIDGTQIQPSDVAHADYNRWIRCDRMVACWILSSMTPDVANSFIYSTNSKDLWLDILECYSQSNAPMIYQLKQEIVKAVQGGLSVTTYYNKLKRLWDDLQTLRGIPVCICGAKCTCKITSRTQELENEDKLMHFLINLSPEFDTLKSQILAMDPLPTLSKAYHLVLQVEKQKQINPLLPDPSAFSVGTTRIPSSDVIAGSQAAPSSYNRKEQRKHNKHCHICNLDGHSSDSCFEVIGYPDWYKGKKSKRVPKLAGNVVAHSMDTPLDMVSSSESQNYDNMDPAFLQAVYSQMMKLSKGKGPVVLQAMAGPAD